MRADWLILDCSSSNNTISGCYSPSRSVNSQSPIHLAAISLEGGESVRCEVSCEEPANLWVLFADGENTMQLIHNIQLRNHLILILFRRLSAPPCTNGVNTL